MPDRRPEDASPNAPATPPEPEVESGNSKPPPQRASEAAEERPVKQGKGSDTERIAAVLAATRGTGQASESETEERATVAPSARGSSQKGAAASPAKSATQKRVRRARLRLTHVDPLSVMKTSFLLSVAIGIVTVVAVAIVWALLGAAGLWDSIDSAITDVLGDSSDGFQIQDYVGTARVLGFTMIVAVVDVILITVIATLAAFLYNLAAALLGGIEVVLAEEDR